MNISFNRPYITGKELEYLQEVIHSGKQSGNNQFATRVQNLMKEKHNLDGVFLTPSCSAALEMGAVLADIQPGDEVIMPSYTFTSTANSILIFGAKPVFCEVSPIDMNMDVAKIESLITSRTKMIIPIDYAGIPCDIDPIMEIADRHGLIVMQDCAQSFGSYYKDQMTGLKAHLACYSFHDTKNISCGEGGALLVNRKEWRERASFIQEKGTDRTKVLQGIQDRYSWIEKGSSYLLSDILAAVLLAQLEREAEITQRRKQTFDVYKEVTEKWVKRGDLTVPVFSQYIQPNYHAFWILFSKSNDRDKFIEHMENRNIAAHIGYIPLHSSKMGIKLGYSSADLKLTQKFSESIVRLPLYAGLDEHQVRKIADAIEESLESL